MPKLSTIEDEAVPDLVLLDRPFEEESDEVMEAIEFDQETLPR